MSLRRILLTTDTVGGVWTYSFDLAGALGKIGIETVLVTMGPAADAEQRAAVADPAQRPRPGFVYIRQP